MERPVESSFLDDPPVHKPRQQLKRPSWNGGCASSFNINQENDLQKNLLTDNEHPRLHRG